MASDWESSVKWPVRQGPSDAPRRSKRPSCSIIIAVHNCADYIGSAIESVLDQSLPPNEVVVCDDGSTDDLADALRPYRSTVKLLRQTQRGEAAARNAAIRVAEGEFVAVLDADDRYHPDRLDALMSVAAARSDIDIVTTDLELFGDVGANARRPLADVFPLADQHDTILLRNFIPAPAFSKARWAQVGGYDESLRYAPDWELYARMIHVGARAALVPRALYSYRQWAGQLSSDWVRATEGRLEVLARNLALDGLSHENTAAIRREMKFARVEYWRALCSVGHADARRESLALARDPLVRWPVRAKALVALAMPMSAGRVVRHQARRRAG